MRENVENMQIVERLEPDSFIKGKPLDDKIIKKLPLPEKSQKLYPDGKVPGLYLRVSQGGTKAWLLTYRVKGNSKLIRDTIGNFDDMGVAAAREAAKDRRADARLGNDPRPKPQPVIILPTVNDLCTDFLENGTTHKRAKSISEDKFMIENYIKPELGKLTIAEVTRFNIEGLLNQIGKPKKDNHPYRANRVQALLGTMFNRAVEVHGWANRNPVHGIKPFPEHKRKRYLSPDEAARLIAALSTYKDQSVSNAILLMLFTGARSGEVLSSTWDQFVDTGDKVIWTKPSAHTKQKTEHRIPLNPYSIEVLNRIKEHSESDQSLLFPSRDGKTHVQTIKKSWKTILTTAKIADHPEYGRFRIHDLRHSFASLLINKGVSLDVIGQLLGHTKISTTYRYAHLSDASLTEGTNKLALDFPVREVSAK